MQMYHYMVRVHNPETLELMDWVRSIVVYANSQEQALERIKTFPNFAAVRQFKGVLPLDPEGRVNSKHGDKWDFYHDSNFEKSLGIDYV